MTLHLKYGDNPYLQKWMQEAKQEEYNYCSTVEQEG